MKKIKLIVAVLIVGALVSCGPNDNSSRVQGEILNHWLDDENEMFVKDVYLVKKENGMQIFESYWRDDESSEPILDTVVKMEEKDGATVVDYGSQFEEYYIIEKNGNLGCYDKNGLYAEYDKVD